MTTEPARQIGQIRRQFDSGKYWVDWDPASDWVTGRQMVGGDGKVLVEISHAGTRHDWRGRVVFDGTRSAHWYCENDLRYLLDAPVITFTSHD